MAPDARASDRSTIGRLGAVTLTVPVLGAAIGIDGGPIFQILATENLDIGSTALGIAFGLGVVSVPVQLWAGRMPLRRARVNTQCFLVVAALQCWILAALAGAGAGAGGRVALVALALTVIAEIALSVLYATSWQPLLGASVAPAARQRLNAGWSAAARVILVVSLLVFGAIGGRWRAVVLVLIGGAAAIAAGLLRGVPAPPADPEPRSGDASTGESGGERHRRAVLLVLVAAALVNVGALPLWLVYVEKALWPGGNLGVVAAVQVLASVVALIAWRPTTGSVTRRALGASVLALIASCAIVLLPGGSPGPVGLVGILLVTAVASGGATTVRIALIEQTHRIVPRSDAVRVFTTLDVVASTSLQIGLLGGGLLISASAATASWPIAPYEAVVIIAGGLAVASTRALRAADRSGQPTRRVAV